MPLRGDLLAPIGEDNPAGANLRYDRVYDQIKEARTEEDDSLPSGAWARQTKRADFRVAAKLAGDALAIRSKDLQLGVWLGEALFKMEGVSALAPTLDLLLRLQQEFWDTLYPEIDEGDAGMRAVPLQWAANRYAALLYAAGLTRNGIGFIEYKAARALGTEEEASSNDQKRKLREEAVAEGKATSEEVDAEIAATPKSFYVALDSSLAESGEILQQLEAFCEERYGDDGPSFRKLRGGIEEVHNLVGSLLREKRQLEPDPVEEQPVEAVSAASEVEPAPVLQPTTVPVAVEKPAQPAVSPHASTPAVTERPQAQAGGGQPVQPSSWDDALARIEAAVGYMTEQQPDSTTPFLVRSALRFAELREIASTSQFESLAAPATELRQTLKRAAAEGDWMGVHRTGLVALAQPSGRGWLDLYRYLWTSCHQLGWQAQQLAVASALQQCLRDVPQVQSWTLDDDTPTANAETMQWIAAEIAPPPAAPELYAAIAEPVQTPLLAAVIMAQSAAEAPGEEDVFVSARSLARSGDVHGAIQLLARDAAAQSIGRLRYRRNLQIAELCVESGNTAVALPVLQGLTREVEERKLESWEPRDSAARPYALLLQCAPAARIDTASVFARLCAIDPSAALTMAPVVEG